MDPLASSPRSPWRWPIKFSRALVNQEETELDRLLAAWADDPTLSCASVSPYEPKDPLSLALVDGSAWGVQQLLDRGFQLTSDVLTNFFAIIEQERARNSPDAEWIVELAWPVILPLVVQSPDFRLQVIHFCFNKEREGILARGVDWDALRMPAVMADFLEEPVLEVWGMRVTPLQYASLTSNHRIVERLLASGADGHREEPRSDMPRWSLAKALAAAESSHEEGWGGQRIQRYFSEAWCYPVLDIEGGHGAHPSEQVLASILFADMRLMGGNTDLKQKIHARLRDQSLSQTLPSPASTKKGPRF